jgi:hypothetical protein
MSSKPLITALASAAAPTLRGWVQRNAAKVERVADAALAVPDDVTPTSDQPVEEVFTPLVFGDVADLTDDGLTDEQRKRALAWIDKRAHNVEGEFDAEDARLAISLLPGWRSEVVETLRAVPMNNTTADRSFPAALVEAGLTHVPVRGNQAPSLGESGYRASNIEGARDVTRYGDKDHRIYVTDEIAARFQPYDAKKTKVKDLPAGLWAAEITRVREGAPLAEQHGPGVVLTKPVVVIAEAGGLRVTNPAGVTETISGKSAWTALYGARDRNFRYAGGLGITEAAKAVLAKLERKVATRTAFAAVNKGGWGGALCPVCFQRAAVTPTTRHMVDHRHTRPGWGYNVAPCEGRLFPPYKDSPEGSQASLRSLRERIPQQIADLRDVLAHPEKQSYTVKVYVRDERGQPVYEPAPPNAGRFRGAKVQQTKLVTVRQGHRLFPERYAADVKRRREEIMAAANSVPFYQAAVRVWHKGLDTAEPIAADVREADTPELPRDLFPTR